MTLADTLPLIWPLAFSVVAFFTVRMLKDFIAHSTPAVKIWVGGAIAAFVDGFIDGAPVGGPAGAGIAVADGKFPTDLAWVHLAVGAAHVLAIPIGTGLADIRAWKKDNPFPNIFAPRDLIPISPAPQPKPASAPIKWPT